MAACSLSIGQSHPSNRRQKLPYLMGIIRHDSFYGVVRVGERSENCLRQVHLVLYIYCRRIPVTGNAPEKDNRGNPYGEGRHRGIVGQIACQKNGEQ